MNRYQRELNRIPLPEETRQALLGLSRPHRRAPELVRDRAGFPTARQQKSSPRMGSARKTVKKRFCGKGMISVIPFLLSSVHQQG